MARVKYKKWTDEDKLYIIANYQTMTAAEIAEVLGRKPGDIANQCRKLNLKKRGVEAKANSGMTKRALARRSFAGQQVKPGAVVKAQRHNPVRSEDMEMLIRHVDEMKEIVGTYNRPVYRKGRIVPAHLVKGWIDRKARAAHD